MSTQVASQNTLLKVILAILLPPLAVFMHSGLSTQFWLNLVLTIVGFWIIGIIHALIVVL
ncbi:YqaE/Pmp3 family membrane protein [Roseimaritima ulvae]|uniref:Proteolipid membrane potential modulator n=1 Tax=Roseimaritima ulvae TaxID=980254 RepID=A0A5B9QT77_9BACT|nr:YqaE/Pmp3 family membrane protein [Roseimaritima ulvae]QEG40940.1 Proteolipid membrane potential modulator [Roseimaritima ulvae]